MPEKSVLEEMKEKNKELNALEDREDMLKKNIAELEKDKLTAEEAKNLELMRGELKKIRQQRAELVNETWKLVPDYNKKIREEKISEKKSKFSFIRRFRKR